MIFAKQDTIQPPFGDQRKFCEFVSKDWRCPLRDLHGPQRFVAGFSFHAMNIEIDNLLLILKSCVFRRFPPLTAQTFSP